MEFYENVPLDPDPNQAAAFIWCNLCAIIECALDYYGEPSEFDPYAWDNLVKHLHYSMASISGTTNERSDFGERPPCDSCDMIEGILALVKYGFVESRASFFYQTSSETDENFEARLNYDLISLFQEPFNRSPMFLAVKVLPKDRPKVNSALKQALELVTWLAEIKEGTLSTAVAEYSEDGGNTNEEPEAESDSDSIIIPEREGVELPSGVHTHALSDATQINKQSVTVEETNAKAVIEKNAFKFEANPEIHNHFDATGMIREIRELLNDEHNRRGDVIYPKHSEYPSDDDAPMPPLDSRVSRADLAAKLGRTTETLQGWEQKGLAPGGVVWPKAEVTKNNAFYNFREVWQPFLSLLPDKDRTQQVLLIEGLSITKRP